MLILMGLLVLAVGAITAVAYFKSHWHTREQNAMAAVTISGGIATAIIIVTMPFIGIFDGYSEGERIGYVTKFSYKGIIFKTYEGELQLGVGTQASLQPPWQFSVTDEELIFKLHEAAHHGRRVKLTYSQWAVQPAWEGKSGYRVEEVELLD